MCSAWNLVHFLRKLADQGQAILSTIHQPSSLLFESFDRLLLLQKGGKTVYFGEISHDSKVIQEYFAHHGAQCPSNVNPVEYMLEAIGAGVMPSVGNQDWKDTWLRSREFINMKEEIAMIKKMTLLENLIAQSDLSTRFCCIPTLNCQTSKDLAPDKRMK